MWHRSLRCIYEFCLNSYREGYVTSSASVLGTWQLQHFLPVVVPTIDYFSSQLFENSSKLNKKALNFLSKVMRGIQFHGISSDFFKSDISTYLANSLGLHWGLSWKQFLSGTVHLYPTNKSWGFYLILTQQNSHQLVRLIETCRKVPIVVRTSVC